MYIYKILFTSLGVKWFVYSSNPNYSTVTDRGTEKIRTDRRTMETYHSFIGKIVLFFSLEKNNKSQGLFSYILLYHLPSTFMICTF